MVDIFTVMLVVMAALCNVVMDLSSEGYFSGYWDKATGSSNKYKHGEPELGPAFFLSTTVLVWLTDGWHLMQFLMFTSLQLAIAINTSVPLLAFITLKVLFSGVFELFYSHYKGKLKK